MAAAVQQVLQELSDLVPVVLPRVAEVLEAGEAVHEQMAEARDRFQEMEAPSASLAEALALVVRESVEQAQEDQRHYAERMEAYEEAGEALKAALEEAQEVLEPAAEEAHHALRRIHEAAAANGRLTHYEQRQVAAAERDGEIARRRSSRLEDVMAALRQRQEALVESLAAAHQAVEEECERLSGRIGELQEQTAEQLDQLEARTRAAIDLVDATFQDAEGAIAEGGTQALEALEAALGGEGVPAILGPGGLIGSVMERAHGGVTLASVVEAAQHEAREAFAPLFDGVAQRLDPVDLALGAIRGAASLVGLGQH